MSTLTASTTASPRISLGPWLWGPRTDLALFAGSALVALGLVAVGHATGLSDGALPEWGWLVLVLGVDVAHVWATLFRTYFDSSELEGRRLRYFGVPVLVYVAGVLLYLHGPLSFWRVLAYAAVFHFVRQQVGWVAVYRARAGQRGLLDKLLDEATVYTCTLYPILFWHVALAETRFAWFVEGDFVDLSAVAGWLLPYARGAWLVLLVAFFVRQLVLLLRTGTLHLGKIVVVTTTAAIWYVGIVATNSDFDFTVTNVIVHGVPYFALLWAYARERRKEAPEALGSQIAAGGVAAFMGILLLVAFVEEMAWAHLVWRDRDWLFGSGSLSLSELALALVVPLLTVPQATHYVLDGILWRRGETRRLAAQRAALGFSER